MIYFDNAATTALDAGVLETMMPYFQNNFGNPSSIHALGRKSRAAIEKARKTVAKHLQASVGEIFFTSGGTESTNTALWGAVRNLGVQHIISSPTEHHCVLHTIQALEKYHHIQAHYLPLLPNGHVNLQSLSELLPALPRGKVLVSLMHANNEIGNLLPLQTVSEICMQHNALFHTDTVQTFGYYTIDLSRMSVDFLTGSAHKFHGPKGIGFLYINHRHHIDSMLQGGSQERNMRAGTENLYGIVGLGAATELAYHNLNTDSRHIAMLKQYFMQQIKQALPQVTFNGDAEGQSHYKVLNVGFPPELQADLLLLNLDIAGICASGGSACSSGIEVGSHVLQALGVHPQSVNIRFSFSKYNTLEEINTVIETLCNILKVASPKPAYPPA
ncbi:cysteine desulfurase [Sphingobacteriales bacterium UPWRP_1]|nr:cysteine desulfurase [Sphingobacteriales bacterium TSM_CSM]PSJ75711.1 cysteine desulfurase [Sphingobacteriales bacterium UPWRP_1]